LEGIKNPKAENAEEAMPKKTEEPSLENKASQKS
jgi:hypothetical protein